MYKMRAMLILSVVLGVAYGYALHDNFASKKIYSGYDGNVLPKKLKPFNDPPEVINGEFITPLDHFSPTEARQLRLNFQSHVGFFEDNGPIFVNINDGAGIEWITSGLVHDLAREVGGALVTSDYRYTGRNLPKYITDETIRFFTVDQILGDVAHLINAVRSNFDAPDAKVVIFGARFGGTIAGLARKKFPHLIDGVWTSGGIFTAIVPEASFFNSISWNIFHHGGPQCARTLSEIFGNVTHLVETKNQTRLSQLFDLCETNDFSKPLDAETFYERLFLWIGSYVDNRHYGGIQEICNDINRGPNPLTAFARWLNYVYDTNGTCRDYRYSAETQRRDGYFFIEEYLFCHQIGINFFVTSANATGGVFPNVINETLADTRCKDIHRLSFNRTLLNRAVDNFNVQHGSHNQRISNAIFTFGSLDPFLDHGVIEYDPVSSELVGTPLHSSGADLTSLSDYDSAGLQETKNRVLAALRRFISHRETEPPGPTDSPVVERNDVN